MSDRLSYIAGLAAWTFDLIYNPTSKHFVYWLFQLWQRTLIYIYIYRSPLAPDTSRFLFSFQSCGMAEGQPDFHYKLECSLCLDQFVDPRALPCGHTFCFHCLTRLEGLHIKCPLCRSISLNPAIGGPRVSWGYEWIPIFRKSGQAV